MTEQQAIKVIQNDLEWHSKELKPAYKEVLKMAIQALEEIQQYRAIGTVEQINRALDLGSEVHIKLKKYQKIGTVEECRTAVEMMKPKKAKWHPNPCVEDNRIPICPNCNTIMVRTEIFGRTIDEHCVSCGQAIDWSE